MLNLTCRVVKGLQLREDQIFRRSILAVSERRNHTKKRTSFHSSERSNADNWCKVFGLAQFMSRKKKMYRLSHGHLKPKKMPRKYEANPPNIINANIFIMHLHCHEWRVLWSLTTLTRLIVAGEAIEGEVWAVVFTKQDSLQEHLIL